MDMIENGVDAGPPDEPDLTWSHPATLGLSAFVLAVLSLFGARVLSGLAYTLEFASRDGGNPFGSSDAVVVGAFLSAAFALLPLTLAWRGLTQVISTDASWVGHVLRAAVVLAVTSLVLHLVIAFFTSVSDRNGLYGAFIAG